MTVGSHHDQIGRYVDGMLAKDFGDGVAGTRQAIDGDLATVAGQIGDNVDAEQTLAPRRWDIGAVRRFMISFGLISSLFDFLTFGLLLLVLHASVETFRTAWFVESLLTQLAIVLIVRTYHAFWLSRPSPLLFALTLGVALLAITIPYLPIAGWFGFVPLPLPVLGGVIAITTLYLIVSEATKRWFFAREHRKQVHRPKPRHP